MLATPCSLGAGVGAQGSDHPDTNLCIIICVLDSCGQSDNTLVMGLDVRGLPGARTLPWIPGRTKLLTNAHLRRIAVVALGLVALSTRLSAAGAQDSTAANEAAPIAIWEVTLTEGDVRWRQLAGGLGDGTWQPVEMGLALVPPAEVETGADGRIRLNRRDEVVRAGPGTRLTLEADRDLWTRIRQAVGKAWYGVRRGFQRRFRVDTQYMVAAVKGTEFEIEAGADSDRLTVYQGVVAATPAGGGEGIDVAAGQSVIANSAGLTLVAAPGTEGGGSRTAPAGPDPVAPQEEPGGAPDGGGNTGDSHGVNQDGQHNHAGDGGASVRGDHSNPSSPNGGGSNAQGPKN